MRIEADNKSTANHDLWQMEEMRQGVSAIFGFAGEPAD
jgi:hypothetical protein